MILDCRHRLLSFLVLLLLQGGLRGDEGEFCGECQWDEGEPATVNWDEDCNTVTENITALSAGSCYILNGNCEPRTNCFISIEITVTIASSCWAQQILISGSWGTGSAVADSVNPVHVLRAKFTASVECNSNLNYGITVGGSEFYFKSHICGDCAEP